MLDAHAQVRFEVLVSFFKRVPNVVVRHKLCDLAFTSDLRKARPLRFTPSDPAEFVYWYTRPEGTPFEVNPADGPGVGASTGVEIGALERRLAAEGIGGLLDLLTNAPSEKSFAMDEDMLAFFLAALRQGVEQELVQLRVASATPKPAELQGACARQLDLLLESNPLRGTDIFGRFRAYVMRLLTGPLLQSLMRGLSFELPRRRTR